MKSVRCVTHTCTYSMTQNETKLDWMKGVHFPGKPISQSSSGLFWAIESTFWVFCASQMPPAMEHSSNTMSVAHRFCTCHRYPHCWVWPPGMWVCTCVHMPMSWHSWRCQSQVLEIELALTVLVEKHLYLLCRLSHQPSQSVFKWED